MVLVEVGTDIGASEADVDVSVFPVARIMQTSPYNEYPLTPHFYIVKLGFTGVYIFFLFLL